MHLFLLLSLFLAAECQSASCYCGKFTGNHCGTRVGRTDPDFGVEYGPYLVNGNNGNCQARGLYKCITGTGEAAQLVSLCGGTQGCLENSQWGLDNCNFRNRKPFTN